ncbi:hypothetical protein K402DRAFT_406240 [Aulographum hederae CBS 113979]|uniref:FAD-binding FR-type domain-containing protein n=1 Tax=Aulographum hederae CBS 113979 TaxID=1176131 RepID=A0A6G1GU47_9PEZI|nr:hypothetical protein K402DRAFT_406240 [Aulographum hederae CBS 113979]
MKSSTLFCLISSFSAAQALIGYPISMYKPLCAFSCRDSISSAPLSCSEEGHGGGHMGHGGSAMTTPECRSADTPFLTTLAFCINSTCSAFGIETWRLEKYWADKCTGDPSVLPKWTYSDTLRQLQGAPAQELPEEEAVLNYTALVPHETWDGNYRTLENFEEQETKHSRYGIVLLVAGFALPIVLTAIGYLPYMTGVYEKLRPYIIYPSTVGSYHIRPLPYLLGNAPTAGQALYIAFFVILNVAMTAAGYRATQPNMWFASTYQEIMAYSSARTGVLAFALAPLVILFSGRNNILLWVTGWSHSTFMVLHRWVARIFGIQVILHSVLELALYIDMGEYEVELVQPYWIWGIVATVACCIMLVVSGLYFRRLSYEVFLVVHIIMAVFVLAGSWYHVELLFERRWGYEYWIYAACAVWFFDRLLRVLRIAKVGVCRTKVTELGDNYVRLDVKDVRWTATPGRHAYAHFPLLSKLTPWTNHPFSIIPTAMLQPRKSPTSSSSDGDASSASSQTRDVEKSMGAHTTTTTITSPQPATTAGVSFYIKKGTGCTRHLRTTTSLLTLLDGPYPSSSPSAILKCDRLLLIGGGIGITGLLPWATAHPNVKLAWSVKEEAQCVVDDLATVLKGIRERDVRVGERFDVGGLLEEEVRAGWGRIGVVVCGPGGLCDDVRAEVVRKGREGVTRFELEVDAFSW